MIEFEWVFDNLVTSKLSLAMPDVTTYYLEMRSKADVRAKDPITGFSVIKCELKQYEYNRFLYQLVGEPWQWTDRLKWSDAEWKSFVEDSALHTWVGYSKGCPAGYYELQQQDDGDVEIAYFGLNPRFIGMGFGGYLLTHALQNAWKLPATKRVWVHTCTRDHHAALKNYQARGLKIFKQTGQ